MHYNSTDLSSCLLLPLEESQVEPCAVEAKVQEGQHLVLLQARRHTGDQQQDRDWNVLCTSRHRHNVIMALVSLCQSGRCLPGCPCLTHLDIDLQDTK